MAKDPICGMTVDEASGLRAERDGGGVHGQVKGPSVLVGKQAFLEQNHVENVAALDERSQ